MNERGMPIPVRTVGAVLVRDGKILLGRRSAHKREFPGMWDVVGGHVEAGEDDVAALVRELKEELDVEATGFAPCAAYTFGNGMRMQVFIVDAWRGVPIINNDEHSELQWFDIDAACALSDLASPEYIGMFGTVRARVLSRAR